MDRNDVERMARSIGEQRYLARVTGDTLRRYELDKKAAFFDGVEAACNMILTELVAIPSDCSEEEIMQWARYGDEESKK